MAGMDYACCSECGKRLFYDGSGFVRDVLESHSDTIVCGNCVDRLKKKIEKLKKHDRRRH